MSTEDLIGAAAESDGPASDAVPPNKRLLLSRNRRVRRLFSWTRQSYLHPTGIPGDSEDP